MRVLILNGSPRPKGNTKQMVSAFCEGLTSAGHAFDVVDVCRLNIRGCLACDSCHRKGGGKCVQKDDMEEIYALLGDADMLVIASPIYFHGLSGQLKCVIDRLYAVLLPKRPEKLAKAAMILSSGEPDMYDGVVFSYQGDFLDYLQMEGMGVFTVHGCESGVPEEKLDELRRFGASL